MALLKAVTPLLQRHFARRWSWCVNSATGVHRNVLKGEPVYKRNAIATSLHRSYSVIASPIVSEHTSNSCHIELEDNGLFLIVEWKDGVRARFHAFWLRLNCRCPACRDPTGCQRVMDPLTVCVDSKVIKHNITEDGFLILRWCDDIHEGRIPLSFLRKYRYEDEIIQRSQEERQPLFSTNGKIPEMSYKDMTASIAGTYKWVKTISDYGHCLLRDVPVELGYIKKVAQMIGPVKNSSWSTGVFDVKTPDPDPVTIAYSPGVLPYHMDLMYLECPAGLELLHCIRFDKEITGGITSMIDMFHVVEEFRKYYPEEFKILCTVPVQHERILRHGNTAEYFRHQRPIITLDPYDQVVALRWNSFTDTFCGIKHDDLIPFYKAYKMLFRLMLASPTKVEMRFEPGDLWTFNNRRMVHSRSAMNMKSDDLVRHLQGVYVDIDDFQSRVQCLAIEVGDPDPVKRCGNSSWI